MNGKCSSAFNLEMHASNAISLVYILRSIYGTDLCISSERLSKVNFGLDGKHYDNTMFNQHSATELDGVPQLREYLPFVPGTTGLLPRTLKNDLEFHMQVC